MAQSYRTMEAVLVLFLRIP